MRNNLGLGIVGGLVSCLLSAAIWAGIAAMTGMMIGWIAIGVGFLVGFAVRLAGEGTTPVFGVVAAVFALVATALGNVFAVIAALAELLDQGFFEVLGQFDWSQTGSLLAETFEPIDLLFYGFAGWFGFKTGWIEEVVMEQPTEMGPGDQPGGGQN